GLRWTTEQQWHVTLRFLGEADVEAAAHALASVRYPRRPVAVLGPDVGRLGRSVLHVPVAGLDDLAAAVVAATAGVGSPPPDRPFRGHLTLGRSRKGRASPALPAGGPVTGRWEVDEVTLVASRLHPEGAQYSVVRRLALPTE
nr:RNA 2',3'-cyclic phosphodiesterase [Actinomycetota bacterium]